MTEWLIGHRLEGTKRQSNSLYVLFKLDAISPLQQCFGEH